MDKKYEWCAVCCCLVAVTSYCAYIYTLECGHTKRCHSPHHIESQHGVNVVISSGIPSPSAAPPDIQ